MPPTIRCTALALALSAAIAGPAHAKSAVANPFECTPQPTLSQPFAAFGDSGWYTPVADAGLEAGGAGWTLSGGAAVVADNQPWGPGEHALALPPGASAVTAPVCIDETYPHFRLFARNAGGSRAGLDVTILYYDGKGRLVDTRVTRHVARSAGWRPTAPLPIEVFDRKGAAAAAPVAFRFTPHGKRARYVIDDVFVDPWSRS